MANSTRLPEVVINPTKVREDGESTGRWESFRASCRDGHGDWSCLKSALPGDLYLFWFGNPVYEIAGVGVVHEEARRDSDWDFYCDDFRPLLRLKQPLTLNDLRSDPVLAPWWRGQPYRGKPKRIVDPAVVGRLLGLIRERNTDNSKLLKVLQAYSGDAMPAGRSVARQPALMDDDDAPPGTVEVVTTRIVRNTAKGEDLKKRYGGKCQVCGFSLKVPASGGARQQVEVHHFRPLGSSHSGLDNHDNMLVLCANCHAGFDYLTLAIEPGRPPRIKSYDRQHPHNGKRVRFIAGHTLAPANLRYHWQRCQQAWAGPREAES